MALQGFLETSKQIKSCLHEKDEGEAVKHSKLLLNFNKHPRKNDHEYVFYRALTLTARFSMIFKPGPRWKLPDLKNDP
jgi:hypothetical protein